MKTSSPEKLHEWLITLLLIFIFLLILISSLHPFQLIGSLTEFKAALLQEGKGGEMTILDLIPDIDTVTERLIVFIPFGFLIHQKLIRHQPQHTKAMAVTLVILVALGIEIAQAAISARHSRVLDFILATAAGIVGIKLSIPIYHIHTRAALDTTYRLLPGFLWLGNYLVACICIASIISANVEIGEWDCHYPLLVGNELTHDRPWHGKIRGVAIYPKELTVSEIRYLSLIHMTPEHISPRITAGAVALYSFEVSNNNHKVIHVHAGPALDLTKKKLDLGGRQLDNSSFQIHEPLLIKSTEPARTVCNTIIVSKAFTIETEIASSNLKQGGPARIISNSTDLKNRNFMLGEEKGELVLRVRTPQNGSNGNNIPYETQGKTLSAGWKHVIASYADGSAKIFIDGKEVAMPLDYNKALFLDTTLSAKTTFAASFLLLCMGVMASMLFHQRPPLSAAAMSIFPTSLIPIIAVVAPAIWLGRPLNLMLIGTIVLIPFLGFILFRLLKKRIC